MPSGKAPSRASTSSPDQTEPRTSRAATPASVAPDQASASRIGKVATRSSSANSAPAMIHRLRAIIARSF